MSVNVVHPNEEHDATRLRVPKDDEAGVRARTRNDEPTSARVLPPIEDANSPRARAGKEEGKIPTGRPTEVRSLPPNHDQPASTIDRTPNHDAETGRSRGPTRTSVPPNHSNDNSDDENPDESPARNGAVWLSPEATHNSSPKPYVSAKGQVQRLIDLTLLLANMSRLAAIIEREESYPNAVFVGLVVALIVSMVAQVIAAGCFYIVNESKKNRKVPRTTAIDHIAFVCVLLIVVLNVFVVAFEAQYIDD